MSERLSITPLGPYIGAQISGADLTRPPSVLANCIFTLFTLMPKGLTRSSCWIPITIIRRITTTGIPM